MNEDDQRDNTAGRSLLGDNQPRQLQEKKTISSHGKGSYNGNSLVYKGWLEGCCGGP